MPRTLRKSASPNFATSYSLFLHNTDKCQLLAGTCTYIHITWKKNTENNLLI